MLFIESKDGRKLKPENPLATYFGGALYHNSKIKINVHRQLKLRNSVLYCYLYLPKVRNGVTIV